MSIRDAGDAIAYLPNLSQDLGQSGVDDAKPKTEASSLSSGLSDLLNGSRANVVPLRCAVGILLTQLDDNSRQLIVRLIDGARDDGTIVPASAIAGVLQQDGYKVSAFSIRRHRRRLSNPADSCTCE